MATKKIEVLGPGCANCETLFAMTNEAVERLRIDAEVVKIKDMGKIIERGVMMTPALVVDGEVVASGRVPRIDEIEKLIS